LSVKKELSIGVLAVQGDIEENIAATRDALREMDVIGDAKKVIYPEQIERVDGLILPGGESTVVSNLVKIQKGGIFQSIRKVISNGLPTLGTCAGMIMLSKRAYDRVIGETSQQLLGILDIEVERNAFGRQSDSFELDLDISLIGKVPFRGIFIRSPVVRRVGNDVNIIAKIDEKIVGVRQENILATSFHPELAEDTRIHGEFINCIIKHKQMGK
jgi:5'-phosphate synthase pdxT subunit